MSASNEPIPTMSRPSGLRTIRSVAGWFLLLAIVSTVLAVPSGATTQGSAGVSPATLSFVDPPALAGGTQQGALEFQQRYDVPVEVAVTIISLQGDWGDARSWMSLDRSGRFTLEPGTHPFHLKAATPDGVPNGLYKAGVLFRIHPPHVDAFEGSGSTAETSVTATIVLLVDNDNEVMRVTVSGRPQVMTAEVDGDLRFTVPWANTGNVAANPHVQVEILDQMQSGVLRTYWFNETILAPGEKGDHSFTVYSHDLPEGQYWARISVFLGDELVTATSPITFDVLKEGALARNAELRRVGIDGNLTKATPGTPLRITAMVANTGNISIVAQFHGEVWRDGALVDLIESSPGQVPLGEERILNTLYTPDTPGRYEIKGHVAYEGKVTEEKSVLIAVEDAPGSLPWLPIGIGVSVIGVGAGGLTFGKVMLRRP